MTNLTIPKKCCAFGLMWDPLRRILKPYCSEGLSFFSNSKPTTLVHIFRHWVMASGGSGRRAGAVPVMSGREKVRGLPRGNVLGWKVHSCGTPCCVDRWDRQLGGVQR